MSFVAQLLTDLRVAARRLSRHPASATVVILLFAVGVSGASMVISFIQAVTTRPPAGTQPVDRAVRIRGIQRISDEADAVVPRSLSAAECAALRARTDLFSDVACWSSQRMSLRATPEASPRVVTVNHADASLFKVLGVVPSLGGLPGSGAGGTLPGAMLSDQLWRTAFAADSAAVGSIVDVGGASLRVVGVAPPGFVGATGAPGVRPLWLLSGTAIGAAIDEFEAVAALNVGVGPAAASKGVASLAGAEQARAGAQSPSITADVVWLRGTTDLPGSWSPDRFYATYGTVVSALVLLLACLNIAGLLTADAVARRGEFAVRIGVGGSRSRLVRQLLAEYALFAVVGAAVGVAILGTALWLLGSSAANRYLTPDVVTFILVALVATGASIAAGLQPAIQASGTMPGVLLRGRDAGARDRGTLQERFLVVQFALTTPILCAAILLAQVGILSNRSDGVAADRVDHLLMLQVTWAGAGANWRDTAHYLDAALNKVVGRPGSSIVRVAQRPGGRNAAEFVAGERHRSVEGHATSPGLLAVLGQELLRGRESMSWADTALRVVPIILSDAAARDIFGTDDVVGRRAKFHVPRSGGRDSVEIIGVMAASPMAGLNDEDPPDLLYLPPNKPSPGEYLIQTVAPAAAVAGSVESFMRERFPQLNSEVVTIRDRRRAEAAGTMWTAGFVIAVALLATLLAAAGIYTVTSATVVTRWREIGVRKILGATTGSILGLMLRRSLRFGLRGMAYSLPPTALVVMATVGNVSLWGMVALTWLAAAVSLLSIAVTASLVATLPALRVHPAEVLRAE